MLREELGAEAGEVHGYGVDIADRARVDAVLADGRGATLAPWTS